MRRVCLLVPFELGNLLGKRAVWCGCAGYAAAAALICCSDALRAAYFSAIVSVPVLLLTQLAPFFLALTLLAALSDTFAGDRRRGVDGLTSACLVGRGGRAAAKLLAAAALCAVLCLFAGALACAFSLARGLFDAALPLRDIGGEVRLTPVCTAGYHIAFAMASLFLGSLHTALLVLCCSACMDSPMGAAAASGVVLLFEWLLHRFSFPVPLREVNLWMFFSPYEFFASQLFQAAPPVNLALLTAGLLPLSVFAGYTSIKRGV